MWIRSPRGTQHKRPGAMGKRDRRLRALRRLLKYEPTFEEMVLIEHLEKNLNMSAKSLKGEVA